MARFSKGQIKMALASELSKRLPADQAFGMAMTIVDAGRVPDDLRASWGAEIADAIDADLADNLRA
jgi:hypothetical protein